MSYAPEPLVVSENGPVEEAPESARPIALYGGGGGGGGEPITQITTGDLDLTTLSGDGIVVGVSEFDGDDSAVQAVAKGRELTLIRTYVGGVGIQVHDRETMDTHILEVSPGSMGGVTAVTITSGTTQGAFVASHSAHVMTLEAVNQLLAPLIARIEALENPEAQA